jgi:hypothetical protein
MNLKLKVHGTLPRTGLLAASGGFAGVEESARELAAGNWGKSWRASYSLGCHHLLQTLVSLVLGKVLDSSLLETGGKARGHRTLSGVIICCKRWSRSCRGKCSIARCWKLGEIWRASYSLGCHHLLQTLVSLVQRKVPDSSLLVGNWGKPEGFVLLRMRSSVVNSGFVRAEKGAQQLLEGNWGKAGGHRTLANAIIRCKQWFRSCRGGCSTAS